MLLVMCCLGQMVVGERLLAGPAPRVARFVARSGGNHQCCEGLPGDASCYLCS